MKWLAIFLLLAFPAFAQTIADYPHLLFEDSFYIVKGDLKAEQETAALNLITENLPQMRNPFARAHTSISTASVAESIRSASEIHYLDRPAIVIGTPCTNEWARKAMKLDNCNVIPGYQGVVALGMHGEQIVILITGGSPEAVLDAATWLQSDAHYRYYGKLAKVRKAYYPSYSGYQIGNGDLLTIGEPIGEVTESITGPRQTVRYSSVGSYLRFGTGGGRVIFGERGR